MKSIAGMDAVLFVLCIVLALVVAVLLLVQAWVLVSLRDSQEEELPAAPAYAPGDAYRQLERTWTIEEAREKLPLIMTPQMQKEMGMNRTSRLDMMAAPQQVGGFRVVRTIEMTFADEVV